MCNIDRLWMLSSGHMAGHHHYHHGGGSNYLCLPEEPEWRNHSSAGAYTGWLYGVEYYFNGNHASFFSTVNTGGRQLLYNPVPCAVCYVPQRATSVMMPASTNCPDGWTQEYGGYLMSEHSYSGGSARHAASYICVDQEPEIATGGVNQRNSWILVVRVGCGDLPCPKYPQGSELACVVCSK